jgi:hypothetical protein
VKEAFTLAPLDSKLFDPAATPLLNQVRFTNWKNADMTLFLVSCQVRRCSPRAKMITYTRSVLPMTERLRSLGAP